MNPELSSRIRFMVDRAWGIFFFVKNNSLFVPHAWEILSPRYSVGVSCLSRINYLICVSKIWGSLIKLINLLGWVFFLCLSPNIDVFSKRWTRKRHTYKLDQGTNQILTNRWVKSLKKNRLSIGSVSIWPWLLKG